MSRTASSRSRSRSRRFSPVELAVGFALVGSLLAVVVPTFVREVHASRLVEPVDGLQRLGAAAVAYGRVHPASQGFPASAPLTPAAVPRGRCLPDDPGAWEHPTWRALDFRPRDTLARDVLRHEARRVVAGCVEVDDTPDS